LKKETTMSVDVDTELRDRAVQSICAQLPVVLRREVPELTADTRLMDLDLTSASVLELMLLVEDELDIQINVEEFDEEHVQSILTLAEYVAMYSVV
jgi:acyl carrier protein